MKACKERKDVYIETTSQRQVFVSRLYDNVTFWMGDMNICVENVNLNSLSKKVRSSPALQGFYVPFHELGYLDV